MYLLPFPPPLYPLPSSGLPCFLFSITTSSLRPLPRGGFPPSPSRRSARALLHDFAKCHVAVPTFAPRLTAFSPPPSPRPHLFPLPVALRARFTGLRRGTDAYARTDIPAERERSSRCIPPTPLPDLSCSPPPSFAGLSQVRCEGVVCGRCSSSCFFFFLFLLHTVCFTPPPAAVLLLYFLDVPLPPSPPEAPPLQLLHLPPPSPLPAVCLPSPWWRTSAFIFLVVQ